jgi:hypothetical protein
MRKRMLQSNITLNNKKITINSNNKLTNSNSSSSSNKLLPLMQVLKKDCTRLVAQATTKKMQLKSESRVISQRPQMRLVEAGFTKEDSI